MRAEVKKIIGEPSEGMVDLYHKCNPKASPSDIYFLIASDYSYGAKTIKVAERRTALRKGPVYLYYCVVTCAGRYAEITA
jgi:para-nitrobenzyl esterase